MMNILCGVVVVGADVFDLSSYVDKNSIMYGINIVPQYGYEGTN
jgi:hypothetical protein